MSTLTADRPLRLGTRRSVLARTQSQHVADALGALSGRPVELVEIVTEGDVTPGPLAALGGTGVFVSALRDALLDGRVDLAVHSFKDLPTGPADGLVVAAVPEREDARDVLVAREGRRLEDLPRGATVGTGSPRRAAMIRALCRETGQDLEVVDVRGNVDTRLGLVDRGELDAVVLARAGLARLGRLDAVTETIDIDRVVPAPAQGALAVETRADGETAALVAGLDHAPSRACVTAERAVLAALEAGCSAPLGAHAVTTTSESAAGGSAAPSLALQLRAAVVALDGSAQVRQSATGVAHDAEQIGRALAADLLAAGAPGLLGERLP